MTPPDPATPTPHVTARNFDRLALAVTLSLLWINLATTGRWANVPGSLRGARLPNVAVALGLTTLLAFRKPAAAWWGAPDWLPRSVLIVGASVLAASFLFAWFPPATWTSASTRCTSCCFSRCRRSCSSI
jgi:hypothetical protein